MPFSVLDFATVSRALSRLKERDDESIDAYFEVLEEVEQLPEEDRTFQMHRVERGFSVRLRREGRSWMASADEVTGQRFEHALRQVARVHPRSSLAVPGLRIGNLPDENLAPLEKFPTLLARAIRVHHVAFPYDLRLRRHRRALQSVSEQLQSPPQMESWYSLEWKTPWGRGGTLEVDLSREIAANLAKSMVAFFNHREAASPQSGSRRLVLGPKAAAVFLHEAVAHALEADVLAAGGRPEAAIGLPLGWEGLNVIDDPQNAPPSVAREVDDEGSPTRRRWLLRNGVVEQPLADTGWTRGSTRLEAGAGRRSDRHVPVIPRCHHLELLPGEADEADLLSLAEGGLWFNEVSWGRLDPWTGKFQLSFPWGRKIEGGQLTQAVGPCRLQGTVAELLEKVLALESESHPSGAGWCAKEAQRLPVWANTPSLTLRDVEIHS